MVVVLPTLECGGGGGGRYLEMARTCCWGWWVAGSWGPVPATWPHRQGSMGRGIGEAGRCKGESPRTYWGQKHCFLSKNHP